MLAFSVCNVDYLFHSVPFRTYEEKNGKLVLLEVYNSREVDSYRLHIQNRWMSMAKHTALIRLLNIICILYFEVLY